MISRCANPACPAEFGHREGRIFRFPKKASDEPTNTHSVQHFWLCGDCAKLYALEYIEKQGVELKARVELAHPDSRRFIAAA
ncbi:MAG TPA: hypothetical protein VHX49_00355 [Candidatus Acidoferrales bacterium]|nr:hypothetical protein [Candidatus Acidoferrales bacterium]